MSAGSDGTDDLSMPDRSATASAAFLNPSVAIWQERYLLLPTLTDDAVLTA